MILLAVLLGAGLGFLIRMALIPNLPSVAQVMIPILWSLAFLGIIWIMRDEIANRVR